MKQNIFEIRFQFTQMLDNLSTSKKYLGTCSSYCMKHYDCSADLFDCMMSELADIRSTSLYLKHIMMLLENVCSASLANSWVDFRNAFEHNIEYICNSIFHPNRSLDYHIEYILRMFEVIFKRHWLKHETIKNATNIIKQYKETHEPCIEERSIDKTEFFERIEEERDQQKRLRELLWFINPKTDPFEQVKSIYTSLSDWNSDDEGEIKRERETFEQSQAHISQNVFSLNLASKSK